MKKLEAVIKQISMDESLHISAPGTLLKPPEERGDFDQLVIGQIEQNFDQKIAQIQAKLDEGADARASAAQEVHKAEEAHKTSEDKQKEVSVEVCAAKEAQKTAAKVLAEACKAVTAYASEYAAATEARDAKKAELEDFIDGGLATFQELKERQSAKKKRELAAKAAEEEEAAAKAAAAEAEPATEVAAQEAA
mmetsp:Transcript_47422/g.88736  ORF Transcript_47422/g.88736 Transcript_47422/m.88736 type:complete len:193 (-) Transcript_47422:172-750(-)